MGFENQIKSCTGWVCQLTLLTFQTIWNTNVGKIKCIFIGWQRVFSHNKYNASANYIACFKSLDSLTLTWSCLESVYWQNSDSTTCAWNLNKFFIMQLDITYTIVYHQKSLHLWFWQANWWLIKLFLTKKIKLINDTVINFKVLYLFQCWCQSLESFITEIFKMRIK